ncbi:hypothetical protein AVEN_104722-1 [Araneus ventricosus]|uniref:Neurotransmitter-gated ion-channel transmembrane domain-containing protein n=1 Tax=Araneus ventricosus TaxID=182803 RepID=A0A4Y2LS07_ARAVE|nr:hypothetical protein AVEN_104722-1 [Araneus ventricosus]
MRNLSKISNALVSCAFQESSPPLPNGTKPKLISSVYRHNRHRHRAILVDKISRVIFPLSFVILNTAYWSVYLDTGDGPVVL